MADTTFTVVDKDGVPVDLLAFIASGGALAVYHREEAAQRSALLSALALLATRDDLAAVVTSLGGALTVTGMPAAVGQHAAAQSLPVVLASDPDYRPGQVQITAIDTGVSSAVGQGAGSILTGAPSANSAQSWALNGHASATLTIVGTWVGLLQIETSADGEATYAPAGGKLLGVPLVTNQISGKAVVRVDVTGMTHIRVRAVAWTSGQALLKLAASSAPGLTQVINQVSTQPNYGASGLAPVIGTFTNAASVPGAWFTPIAGRPFNISLRGAFNGAQVQLERTFDGGVNAEPLTAGGTPISLYTAAVSEQFVETEVGVAYRFNPTVAPSSGTINHRVSQ
jgi:hypothetical protein